MFIPAQNLFVVVHAEGSFRIKITQSGAVLEPIMDLTAPNLGRRIAIFNVGNGNILSCYQGAQYFTIQTYEN